MEWRTEKDDETNMMWNTSEISTTITHKICGTIMTYTHIDYRNKPWKNDTKLLWMIRTFHRFKSVSAFWIYDFLRLYYMNLLFFPPLISLLNLRRWGEGVLGDILFFFDTGRTCKLLWLHLRKPQIIIKWRASCRKNNINKNERCTQH